MIEAEILDFLLFEDEIKEIVINGVAYEESFKLSEFKIENDTLIMRLKNCNVNNIIKDINPLSVVLKQDNKTMMLGECYFDRDYCYAPIYGVSKDFVKITII